MANEMNNNTTPANLKCETPVNNSFDPCFKMKFFNLI